MAKLRSITIENYRSISDPLELYFPDKQPLVIIGENNAGKSNIIKAIDMLFGESWPGTKTLENHEYWQRNPSNKVVIEAKVEEIQTTTKDMDHGWSVDKVSGFYWESTNDETNYNAICNTTGSNKGVITRELQREISSLIVNADHNLTYQLSYASKWTLLSRVMRAFHKELTSDDERVKKLKRLFKDIENTFYEVPEFKDFAANMTNIAGQMIGNMTHGLELDFSSYDPNNFFHSLKVLPCEEGEARTFEELGTGQQQILALTFAHAYSKSFLGENLILILDEPEAHLHPLAQRWLARTIYKMAEDGLQVIITTHSPHFINLNCFEGLCLVRKDKFGTETLQHSAQSLFDHCVKTGADAVKTNINTVVPFYANNAISRILNGFFAKKIVLVEGLTEELALPEYFRKVGLEIEQEGIDVIGVQGKGNIAKWWRLFTLFEIPTFVCFDNDSNNDQDGNRRKDALKSIGIPENEINGLLSEDAWNINDKFCVFGQDFEKTMRASFPDYSSLELEKQEALGSSSKHVVAREVAKAISFDENVMGWSNIQKLANALSNLKFPNDDTDTNNLKAA